MIDMPDHPSEPVEILAGPVPLAEKPWLIMRPVDDWRVPHWQVVARFAARAEADAWMEARRREWKAACLRDYVQ